MIPEKKFVMWCCCNVRPELVDKQNHLPFENIKHADYRDYEFNRPN